MVVGHPKPSSARATRATCTRCVLILCFYIIHGPWGLWALQFLRNPNNFKAQNAAQFSLEPLGFQWAAPGPTMQNVPEINLKNF